MSDSAPKRVLIVSPSFPPSSTPDLQRIRMSLPYYSANGWEPIVLCVEAEANEAPREDALLATIPDNIPVHRVSATSVTKTRRIGLGNLGWRAFRSLNVEAQKIFRTQKIDLVFFSTTQFAVLPLGRHWRKKFGVPFVVDLQDPWLTDYYQRAGVRKPPGGWKYRFAHWQASVLEPWTLRRCSGLISVSPDYLHDLRRRYNWFAATPSAVIPFGASERDLEVAKNLYSGAAPSEKIRLVYTGAAGPITPHAVSILFEALKIWRDRNPESKNRIQLEFIGTSYAAADRAEPTILPLAQDIGVADSVAEIPARTGHLAGLQLQSAADGLLLLGSTDLAYSPSKLFPYFLSGRPMLALVFQGSELEKRIDELGGAFVARCASANKFEEALPIIDRFLDAAVAGFPAQSPRNESRFTSEYLARSLTAKQTALFDAALNHVELP